MEPTTRYLILQSFLRHCSPCFCCCFDSQQAYHFLFEVSAKFGCFGFPSDVDYVIIHMFFYFPKFLQNTLTHAPTAAVSSSNSRQDLSQKSAHSTRNIPVIKNQTDKAITSKQRQDSGNGYDAKLIEIINTAIVDKSPSVKWEDVGKELRQLISLFVSVCNFFNFYILDLVM